jgi:hypothetical protein
MAIPDALATVIGPMVPSNGTAALICVDEMTTKSARAPLKVTPTTPPKLAPEIVMRVPGDPLSGANCVMIGFGAAARTGGWNTSNKARGRTVLLSQSVDALDKTANNIHLLLTGDCMLFDKLVPFNVYALGF